MDFTSDFSITNALVLIVAMGASWWFQRASMRSEIAGASNKLNSEILKSFLEQESKISYMEGRITELENQFLELKIRIENTEQTMRRVHQQLKPP